MLDKDIKAFVVDVSSLRLTMTIHLARKVQINLLLAKKVIIPAKYSDFTNVFLEESANVFFKQTRANKYVIKLEQSNQPFHRSIYSLRPVEFETFKTHIEINLVNVFIKASKLPTDTLILLVCKPNDSFCLCVNYWGLNNLTIKNWYLLPFIGESPDRLGWAKQFT